MKTIEDRITILNIKSKDNFFAAKVNNLKKENSDMKLVFKKNLLDRVHDINQEYSNKFDEFKKIIQAQCKYMKAKLNSNGLYFEPLSEDIYVKSQNVCLKTRRVKPPTITDKNKVAECYAELDMTKKLMPLTIVHKTPQNY